MRIGFTLLLSSILTAGAMHSACAKEAGSPRSKQVIRYEDALVRLVEVTIAAGASADMPANPFASVSAFDGPRIDLEQVSLDPAAPPIVAARGEGPAPVGMLYPTCETAGASGARRLVNRKNSAAHFYRLDLKRLDADAIKANWKAWYPWMMRPLKPAQVAAKAGASGPFSKGWPFPIDYDSVRAAPSNHLLRYENTNVRLIEVVTRPGETENMHGHPYPSVFAYKGPGLTQMRNVFLSEDNPLNNHGFKSAGWGPAPSGMQYPTCRTLGPEAPHSVTNLETYPLHFYRLEFKRLPGSP